MLYTGKFVNKRGQIIGVNITTNGDKTETREIGANGMFFAATDAVTIESQVSDTFDHLLTSTATIKLSTTELNSDFYNADCSSAVVSITEDNVLIFLGFVEPFTFNQPFANSEDDLELNCIDILTALQYKKYKHIGEKGVNYDDVKAACETKTFYQIIFNEILEEAFGTATTLGIYYDKSKGLGNTEAQAKSLFSDLSINEVLFLGDEEDDTWTMADVLEEVLKYLNLHIVQIGQWCYIFSWETLYKDSSTIEWECLTVSGKTVTTTKANIAVSNSKASDTNAQVTIGEVFNKIVLTDDVTEITNVIESPLDSDSITAAYSGRQKYLTEFISTTKDPLKTFIQSTDDDIEIWGSGITQIEWYVQVMNNKRWTFYRNGQTDVMTPTIYGDVNQQVIPNGISDGESCALLRIGSVTLKDDKKDNSPVSKIDMNNCLVISLAGNGVTDPDSTPFPNKASLKSMIPCAVYKGGAPGGVFSPSDSATTNYLVFSGKFILNPAVKTSIDYADGLEDPLPDITKRKLKDGDRYYTRKWWKADTPRTTPVGNRSLRLGFYGYSDEKPQKYKYKKSRTIWGTKTSEDLISKLGVIQCMLIIGDKCLVENPESEGGVDDFTWQTYKTLAECEYDEDTYYSQSFSLGCDPAIDDYIVGSEFEFQNNITYNMGLDVEGTAIPIRAKDKLSGAVEFKILSPINFYMDTKGTLWRNVVPYQDGYDIIVGAKGAAVLADVENVIIKDFECKVVSDNGFITETANDDIIYSSDTDETFLNPKDDIEFKINSALTTEECAALSVTNALRLSVPISKETGLGVTSIYDFNKGEEVKPEKNYVDSYYTEYHKPRIILEQPLYTHRSVTSPFYNYTHPAITGKKFFVQSLDKDLIEGTTTLTLKEIPE